MAHFVNFKGEKTVAVGQDETLLEASLNAGIPHYHACGGKGQCTTCRVLVIEGQEHLSAPNSCELALKKVKKLPAVERLACQTLVTGSGVEVQRLIRDDTDRYIFTGENSGDTIGEIGECRKLALFFIDIRSFTPFLETNLPFDVIHIMRRIFGLFKNAILQYNGSIIDTAGDGLYAVFGMNSNIRQAAEMAVLAGLRILADLHIFNNTYLRPYFKHTFEAGIGVHTGRVVVGNVGIGLSQNLTVMGYPVNIAARLQDATKTLNNSFVISAAAYRLLKKPPYAIGAGSLQLKGVSNACDVFLIGKPYEART